MSLTHVTLRSVEERRPPSWNATGLIEKAWKRLDPPKRDRLAELLEIKPNNLSKLNRGTMPMTLDYAKRIAAVTPGLSVADLGAPSSMVAETDPTILDRLEELAKKLAAAARKQTTMAREMSQLQGRIQQLEARAWPGEDQSTGQGSR